MLVQLERNRKHFEIWGFQGNDDDDDDDDYYFGFWHRVDSSVDVNVSEKHTVSILKALSWNW